MVPSVSSLWSPTVGDLCRPCLFFTFAFAFPCFVCFDFSLLDVVGLESFFLRGCGLRVVDRGLLCVGPLLICPEFRHGFVEYLFRACLRHITVHVARRAGRLGLRAFPSVAARTRMSLYSWRPPDWCANANGFSFSGSPPYCLNMFNTSAIAFPNETQLVAMSRYTLAHRVPPDQART